MLDISKGWAIILVIVGHIQFLPVPLIHFIFSFHMPVFVLLSGMVFKLNSFSKHFKHYYVMYIVYAVMLSAVDYLIVKPDYSVGSIVANIFLWGGGAPHRVEASPALWFMTSIIVIQLLGSLFIRLYKRSKTMAVVLFLCLYMFAVLETKASLFLPYNLITSIYLMSFFFFGIVVKKYSLPEKIKQFSRYIITVTIVALIVIIFCMSRVNGLINILGVLMAGR